MVEELFSFYPGMMYTIFKERTMKTVFAVVLLLAGAAALSANNVGVLQFELPDDWEIEEEGMSLFAVSPSHDFYVSGMIFYGLPDLKTARTGILPLIRDMFRGFTISNEREGLIDGIHPCLMIEADGQYENIDASLYLLIVNAGDHFPILQLFGSTEGWAANEDVARRVRESIGLSF